MLAVLLAAGCKSKLASPSSGDDAAARVSSATDTMDGCRDNAACGPDEYCAFEPELCGKGRRPGNCRKRPLDCLGAARSPVCGCDGKVYDNACAAHLGGIDLAVLGGCGTRMPSWMPCGKQFCDTRKDYCAIYLSDVFELPTDYFCRPLPASCSSGDGRIPSCDCFPSDVACRSFCGIAATDGSPGFHLTCQGVHPPS